MKKMSSSAAQKRFAAFDIDGTLVRWQLYHAVVNELAKQGLLGKSAQDELEQARMVWKRREHLTAFGDYERKLIEIYEQALPNISTKQFDAAVKQVTDEYKNQVYRFTRELITELKNKGYFLIAISGSHQELVQQIADEYGFDDCIGSQYERSGNTFTGNVYLPNLDKKKTLRTMIDKHNLSTTDSYAVGDSKSDAAMLEIVDNPIAFNPDKELHQIASKNGWRIVVERKNVIYSMEAKR